MKYQRIGLKKIKREQLVVLYESLRLYVSVVNLSKAGLDILIYNDIINTLCYKIDKTLEFHKKHFSLSLTVSEACVIQDMILKNVSKHPYVVMTYENFKDQLQQELMKIKI